MIVNHLFTHEGILFDSGYLQNALGLVSGAAPVDSNVLLEALGSQRGMLYFYLLLARLESTGEIGRPSFERRGQGENGLRASLVYRMN